MTYACNNAPRPTPKTHYQAQDGYIGSGIRRIPRIITVTHKMSCECKYAESGVDVGCVGCQWRAISPPTQGIQDHQAGP
jgi:hypothetical protein